MYVSEIILLWCEFIVLHVLQKLQILNETKKIWRKKIIAISEFLDIINKCMSLNVDTADFEHISSQLSYKMVGITHKHKYMCKNMIFVQRNFCNKFGQTLSTIRLLNKIWCLLFTAISLATSFTEENTREKNTLIRFLFVYNNYFEPIVSTADIFF